MNKIEYKREPIIFSDVDSVTRILSDMIPSIAEENCFKLCNFCGPFRTHADGCKIAIQMFHEQHPEYRLPEKINSMLQSFRLGAVFVNRENRSAVVFLSTVSEKEANGLFKQWHNLFVIASDA